MALGLNAVQHTARYAIVLTPDLEGSGYSVTVPALPGCFAHGETVEEARSEAREAIDCHLDLPTTTADIEEDRVQVIMATVEVAAA